MKALAVSVILIIFIAVPLKASLKYLDRVIHVIKNIDASKEHPCLK